jgi:hypothetical protein
VPSCRSGQSACSAEAAVRSSIQVSSWLLCALQGPASARPKCGSDQTFGPVSAAVGRRADLLWQVSIGWS